MDLKIREKNGAPLKILANVEKFSIFIVSVFRVKVLESIAVSRAVNGLLKY